MIRLIYTFFLSLLIALFVGLGIDAFYPGPAMPEYSKEFETMSRPDCVESPEQKEARISYEQATKEYQSESRTYNKNVSILSLSSAILMLILSLTSFKRIKMISDGILLGGVFTTVYSIIRVLMSEDSKFRFLVVSLGLAIALILGYIKFIRNKKRGSDNV